MADQLDNIMACDEFDYECLLIRDRRADDNGGIKSDNASFDSFGSDDDDDDDDDDNDNDNDNEAERCANNIKNRLVVLSSANPDYTQLFEDVTTMIDDYVRENIGRMSNPAFHDELTAYLFEQLRIVFFASVGETMVVDSERAHSLIYKIITNAECYYFNVLHKCNPNRFVSWRSVFADDDANDDDEGPTTSTLRPPPQSLIDKVTALQQQQNQTEQRTDAWYARRHSLITASSAWKVFGTACVVNQLIYEKCTPYISAAATDPPQYVNVESPLHWGQKYEHLSAAIYQLKNNTRIGEFGCIQHSDPRFSFIGGSPDGINIDETSPLYGRMVEIKNIVNRPITGIPKEEYWIQMQMQMEACDMDAGCDFVETRFVEYSDPQDYYEDVQNDYAYAYSGTCCGDDGDVVRGIILYFVEAKAQKPHYEYMPLEYANADTQEAWITNTISRLDQTTNYIWVRNIYWKLDQYSCVFVPRNRAWFTEYAALQLESVWKIIENERVSGYAHRAPKKRPTVVVKQGQDRVPAACGIVL
jgi:hypothetical protein